MKAEGYGAWWNQHTPTSNRDKVWGRARGVAFVIVKAGYWDVMQRFLDDDVRVGVESYVYPSRPTYEAALLSQGINRGAEFAVVNAEVEWEGTDGSEMRQLCERFRSLQPGVELYASVDTRGNRTRSAYQRVLGSYATAWMPMVYPLAFYPHRPAGFVSKAFEDSINSGQDWQGNKPVLPTIQTYDGIGVAAVTLELANVKGRNLLGCQAYTIGHATDAEWQAFTAGQQQQEDKMYHIVTTNGAYYFLTDGLTRQYIPDFAKVTALQIVGLLPQGIPRGTVADVVMSQIKNIGTMGGELVGPGEHSHSGEVTVR